jgi:hypothetical protein
MSFKKHIMYLKNVTDPSHFRQQNGICTGRDKKKWLGMSKNKVFLTIDGIDPIMDFLSDISPCTQNAACFHRHQLQISYLHMYYKDSILMKNARKSNQKNTKL